MSINWVELIDKDISKYTEDWCWVKPKHKRSSISSILQNLTWHTVYTIENNPQKFQTLIRERPHLMAQYRIKTATLIKLSERLDKYDPRLIKNIEKALKMTVLLKKIYTHLDEPDDIIRATIDIEILNRILHRIDYPDSKKISYITECKVSVGHQLRALHVNTNLTRLTGIRSRRLILNLVAFELFANFKPTVTYVEKFTNPFFLYLGWVFFLPRFLLNSIMLLKQGLDPRKQLPWHLRFEAYLNLHRRGFELWTDTVWLTGGILLCFVLFGPLVTLRPYVIVAVQVSDVIMMMTRSFFELKRLFTLRNEYHDGVKYGVREKNSYYLEALEERIAFEKKVSYLAITNNLLMVIALLSLIPSIIALHPLIPFLGSLLGVLTTIRFYVYNAANDAQQPRTNLNVLLKKYDPNAQGGSIAPATSLLHKLAVPTIVTLTPLIFISFSFNPALTALLCVGLAIFSVYKMQQPLEVMRYKKNCDTLFNYQFFKPESQDDKLISAKKSPESPARTTP